eukprot:gnl/MRDRNA2_/MRDRNA2_198643_c0_seq1.p1 gnl/MRDRNA2_/MRDRNA2_198643_c0~~gnl/MRDRNA2_/MRDRNA2_198643_c0_seq1.p1  ORF type:complete len:128 (-),score=9.24 gnl/MRDRNA2_/MRDRNA2_198643_c0_seq1:118-501(-)
MRSLILSQVFLMSVQGAVATKAVTEGHVQDKLQTDLVRIVVDAKADFVSNIDEPASFYNDMLPHDADAEACMTPGVIPGTSKCETSGNCCVCCFIPGRKYFTFSVTGKECASGDDGSTTGSYPNKRF